MDDQVGSPTYTAHLAEAHRAACSTRRPTACTTSPAAGRVLVARVRASRSSARRASTAAVAGRDDRGAGRGRRRARAYSVLRSERPDAIPLPRLARGPRRLPRRAAAVAAMRLLVTGAAGFIGSAYVREALERRPGDEVVVLDKLTYAGRRENLAEVEDRIAVRRGRDRGPRDRATRPWPAATRSSTSRPSRTSTARSRTRRDFARTHVIGTSVLLEAAREIGVERYLQVSTDEVYGSIDEGSFTERSPLDPSSPYSATKAGGDLLVRRSRADARPRRERSAAGRTTTARASTPRS